MCGITGFWNIAISRAQLARVLEEERLRWYQEETYFTERPDTNLWKKGAIVRLYQSLPPQAHVLCLDEMSLVSAKTYPTMCWSVRGHRPKGADLFHIMTYETNY